MTQIQGMGGNDTSGTDCPVSIILPNHNAVDELCSGLSVSVGCMAVEP